MTRLRLSVAILLVLAGCRDAAAPFDEPNVLGHVVSSPTPSTGMHILRQSPTAPPLETYQVSFWARKDRASTVIVNYEPAAGQSVGLPFLRFDIPKDGLRGGTDRRDDDRGRRGERDDDRGHRGERDHDRGHRGERDSVLITLTIDPEIFSVALEPSGVVFSQRHPATLAIWYGNANPDLDGDGVVDATDQALAEQLALWVRQAEPVPWLKLLSATEAGQQWVWTALYHFSEYAVSW
jgi:hypothetical protein